MPKAEFHTEGNIFRLKHACYEFSYDSGTGRFSAVCPPGSSVTGAEAMASLIVNRKSSVILTSAAHKRKFSVEELSDGAELSVRNIFSGGITLTQTFRFFDDKDFMLVRAGLENASDGSQININSIKPLHIGAGAELRLGPSPASWSVYNLGFQSWTPAEAVRVDERQQRPSFKVPQVIVYNPLRYPPRTKGQHLCEWLGAIKNLQTSDSLICGFVTMKDMLSHIFLNVDIHNSKLKTLSAQCGADRITFDAGEKIDSEWLFLLFTKNPISGMEAWADEAGIQMQARVPADIPVGWCSWYKYFTNITQKDMLSNLDGLQKLSGDIPIRFFQIDDGYQKHVGDWLTLRKKRFPGGMEMLVKKIRDKGFEPGLWVAPFFARTNSRLFAEHRDWFLREESGRIAFGGYNPLWGGGLAPLDLTLPQVQEWLHDTFSVIVNEWGYKYLKLDFLYSAVVRGKFRNHKVTRAQAYRKGMEIIREAAGDDAFILGCGAPLGPSVGIVDAMRIGTDTGPKWREPVLRAFLGSRSDPSVESSLINCVTRSFLHGRLWANDPDCILLRKGNLTHDEYRTFSTIVGLTGGMLLISDDMNELDGEGRRVFSQLVPPTGVPAVPADLFESPHPSVYHLKMDGGRFNLVALINWKSQAGKLGVEFSALGLSGGDYLAFDFWEEKLLGAMGGGIEFRNVAPHGCRLVRLAEPGDAPFVIGSNLHISCGGIEIKNQRYDNECGKLGVTLELRGKRQGKIFVFVPDFLYTDSVDCTPEAAARITARDKNLCAVEVNFSDGMELSLKFKKHV